MEFNQLVLQKLHSLFTEHGLIVGEQSKDFVKYESNELVISISHNVRENAYMLFVGKKDFDIEIDNHVLLNHFNCDLKLSSVPRELFVNNVLRFFVGDGNALLVSEQAWINLEKFNNDRSEDYTTKLLREQHLEVANKAWAEKNYAEFIKYLEKVGMENLPGSLIQKYKIAQKKMSD